MIGAGPAGRQIASRLETVGHEVCVVDTSPVNLHVFSQQGFRTISGDATRFEILYNARVQEATVVIVCISDDDTATRITQSVRQMNPDAMLIIRCRYHGNAAKISRLGADRVVSEEAVASEALVRLLDDHYSKR